VLVVHYGQTRRAPTIEDLDGAGVRLAADGLGRDADRQVVCAVPVEVAGREAPSKVFTVGRNSKDSGYVLVPALIADVRQPRSAAVQDVDCAGGESSDVVARDPDREISISVGVEVSYGECLTEAIVLRVYTFD
jgi:hypothetical protein